MWTFYIRTFHLDRARAQKTVVYLFSGRVSGDRLTYVSPLGTGFITGVPHHEVENRSWPYLVTAKHLPRHNGQFWEHIFLRANLVGWSPTSNQIGARFYRVPVTRSEENLRWATHPNPAVDLAAIQVGPPPETYEVKSIHPDMFAVEEVLQREGVAEGDEVFSMFHARNTMHACTQKSTRIGNQ